MKVSLVSVVYVALLIGQVAAQNVYAQTGTATARGSQKSRPLQRRTAEQQKVQNLSRMEPLADVPAYTGKVKLHVAHLTAANPGGPQYTYVFGTDETPETVHDWYLKALSSAGWKLVRGNEGTTEPILGSKSGGKQISILVQSAREQDERASVTMVFVAGENR